MCTDVSPFWYASEEVVTVLVTLQDATPTAMQTRSKQILKIFFMLQKYCFFFILPNFFAFFFTEREIFFIFEHFFLHFLHMSAGQVPVLPA